MLRRVLFLFAILFAVTSVQGQDSPAWKRVRHLQHGVNASEWFAQSSDYRVERLRSYTTLDDIDRMKRMGFDHVRIGIDPEVFQCTGSWSQCDRVRALDEVISRALSRDLAVVIDLHPGADYKHQMANTDYAVENGALLWGRIADHFSKYDPERVFLEVMNEPGMEDAYRWTGVQQNLVAVIRRHAPEHTIVVSGNRSSGIEDLIRLPEFADRNLIFNFHYYEPTIFTHQGASWGSSYWVGLKDLPFPASPQKLEDAKLRQSDDYARWKLLEYGFERWDEQRIEAEMKFASDWAKSKNVPLICNEFGAYRTFMNPEDRINWLTAARRALEHNKIGWTMWDYRGGFGVVKVEKDRTVEDEKVLRALGLKD